MSGYLKTKNVAECFGCGACEQICCQNAIKMEMDKEGFFYPRINSQMCVKCGLCHSVCPAENNVDFYYPEEVWVGFNRDKEVRFNSASGGAFYGIIKAVPPDALIFGVEWNNRSSVCHSFECVELAYERFHKSKYIQSIIGNTYKVIKKLLQDNRFVVFVGTPCQNAGLRSYLGCDDKNLLCVDLVCHGVSSGRVLEQYFKDIESKKDSVVSIDFRHKYNNRGVWDSKCASITFESGKNKVIDYNSSGFLRGFSNGLFFRPSCSVCPYAKRERVSDITIGDAWGIENYQKDMNPHQGVSVLIINTAKGLKYVDELQKSMQLTLVDYKYIVSGNARLRNPDRGHEKRSLFFMNFERMSFERLVQKYIPRISLVRKVAHNIKIYLKKE